MKLALIVAVDEALGIGKDGDLPWKLPGEMKYFKRITTEAPDGKQNAVIMGRRTWQSIPERFRPLPSRVNVVLSRSLDLQVPEGVLRTGSLEQALGLLELQPNLDSAFVIGGSSVYAEALGHPRCTRLYITRVHATFACDTQFPAFEPDFECINRSERHSDSDVQYTFEVYERR